MELYSDFTPAQKVRIAALLRDAHTQGFDACVDSIEYTANKMPPGAEKTLYLNIVEAARLAQIEAHPHMEQMHTNLVQRIMKEARLD